MTSKKIFNIGDVQFVMCKIPSSDKVNSFWMMETQVTQGLYLAVTGENPSYFNGYRTNGDNWNHDYGFNPQRPVEQVSWEDGIRFANALSTELGLQPAYDGDDNDAELIEGANGFRLPSVAEWEWAAKGGENHKYAGSNDPDAVAWHGGNSGRQTHPVGQLKPNGYGCYDFSGNVDEWCGDYYYSLHVFRGGCWYFNAERIGFQAGKFTSRYRHMLLGLRLACA